MKYSAGHDWDLSPRAAIKLQAELRQRLILQATERPVRRVAGIDVGFEQEGKIARAAAVVLSFPELTVLDCALAREPTRFPYIPGLLSFRELPVVLKALEQLSLEPDVLLCDGHGYAHPRRLGIAAHLGVITDLPAIGVGKSRLTGTHGPVPEARGAWTALMDGAETIGAVLRTRPGVAPIYVSPGHRMDLPAALALVMACTTRYRLPETTRWAHRLASSPAAVSAGLQRDLRANVARGPAGTGEDDAPLFRHETDEG